MLWGPVESPPSHLPQSDGGEGRCVCLLVGVTGGQSPSGTPAVLTGGRVAGMHVGSAWGGAPSGSSTI